MSKYSETAQVRVQEIHAMRDQIPNFVVLVDGDPRRMAVAASLPPEFIELVAVATTNSPPLVRAGATDPDEARDVMSFAEAYTPVADELEALAQFVRHSIMAAKHKVGIDAL